MRSVVRSLTAAPAAAAAAAALPLFAQRRAMTEAEMEKQRRHVERLRHETTGGDPQGSSSVAVASQVSIYEDGEEEAMTVVEQEQSWLRGMEGKYGEGSYELFRPLYKDLCDEMRREYFTKPPPPFPLVVTDRMQASHKEAATAHADTVGVVVDAEGGEVEGDGAAQQQQQQQQQQPPPAATFDEGDGRGEWSVVHQPANNLAVFRRGAVPAARMARVVAFSRVETKDPPKLNALLTFADWCPIEVLLERKGVIVQFSVACNEGGMHMRNVRVYSSPARESRGGGDASGEVAGAANTNSVDNNTNQRKKKRNSDTGIKGRGTMPTHPTPANIFDATDDAEWCRHNLRYDGPCLWHLELDFQNELYDVMQDHGITLDWIRWAAEWVYYLEHKSYAHWAAGVLEEVIPSPQRGPEEDFLLEEERETLDEPAEDWLSARAI